MSDFRRLSPTMFVSPQIGFEDIEAARAASVGLIINNRPDGEAPEEPQGDEIEAAARAAGIDYAAIPVTHAGFSEPQARAMRAALDGAQGTNVLAYCRSGTRSCLLWALAEALGGAASDATERAARAAGYDITPVRAGMEILASRKEAS